MRVQGRFVWYELLTDDPDAAAAFYGALLGWRAEPFDSGEVDYRLFKDGAGNAGGMMPRPDKMREAGGPPQWLGYIGADDVDATAAAMAAAGGTVWMPAMDMGEIGRVALVADPWGAPVYLIKPARTEGEGHVNDPHAIGRCSWNELTTGDLDAALNLYTRLFGWRRDGAMAMGELGDYAFIADGERQIGAAMGPIPGERPRWRFYFRVSDIDAAAGAVSAGGGRVVHGPAPVPTGDHIVIGIDPQGAEFALVGAKG